MINRNYHLFNTYGYTMLTILIFTSFITGRLFTPNFINLQFKDFKSLVILQLQL